MIYSECLISTYKSACSLYSLLSIFKNIRSRFFSSSFVLRCKIWYFHYFRKRYTSVFLYVLYMIYWSYILAYINIYIYVYIFSILNMIQITLSVLHQLHFFLLFIFWPEHILLLLLLLLLLKSRTLVFSKECSWQISELKWYVPFTGRYLCICENDVKIQLMTWLSHGRICTFYKLI